jgi:hypothetical protein
LRFTITIGVIASNIIFDEKWKNLLQKESVEETFEGSQQK